MDDLTAKLCTAKMEAIRLEFKIWKTRVQKLKATDGDIEEVIQQRIEILKIELKTTAFIDARFGEFVADYERKYASLLLEVQAKRKAFQMLASAPPVPWKQLVEILCLLESPSPSRPRIIALMESIGYPEHAAKVRSLLYSSAFDDAIVYVKNLLLQLRPLSLLQLRKNIDAYKQFSISSDTIILVFAANDESYREFCASFLRQEDSRQSTSTTPNPATASFLDNYAIDGEIQVYNLSKLMKESCEPEEDIACMDCLYRILSSSQDCIPAIILSTEFWNDEKFTKFMTEASIQLSLFLPVESWRQSITVFLPPSVSHACRDGLYHQHEASLLCSYIMRRQETLTFPISQKGFPIELKCENAHVLGKAYHLFSCAGVPVNLNEFQLPRVTCDYFESSLALYCDRVVGRMNDRSPFEAIRTELRELKLLHQSPQSAQCSVLPLVNIPLQLATERLQGHLLQLFRDTVGRIETPLASSRWSPKESEAMSRHCADYDYLVKIADLFPPEFQQKIRDCTKPIVERLESLQLKIQSDLGRRDFGTALPSTSFYLVDLRQSIDKLICVEPLMRALGMKPTINYRLLAMECVDHLSQLAIEHLKNLNFQVFVSLSNYYLECVDTLGDLVESSCGKFRALLFSYFEESKAYFQSIDLELSLVGFGEALSLFQFCELNDCALKIFKRAKVEREYLEAHAKVVALISACWNRLVQRMGTHLRANDTSSLHPHERQLLRVLRSCGLLPADAYQRGHEELSRETTQRIVASLNAEKLRSVFGLDFNIDTEIAQKVNGIFLLVMEFRQIAHSWYFDLGAMKRSMYCQQLNDLLAALFRNYIIELDHQKRKKNEQWLNIIKLNLLLNAFYSEIQAEQVQSLKIDFTGLAECRGKLLSLLKEEYNLACAQLVKIQKSSVLSLEIDAILRLRSFGNALTVFVTHHGKESAFFKSDFEDLISQTFENWTAANGEIKKAFKKIEENQNRPENVRLIYSMLSEGSTLKSQATTLPTKIASTVGDYAKKLNDELTECIAIATNLHDTMGMDIDACLNVLDISAACALLDEFSDPNGTSFATLVDRCHRQLELIAKHFARDIGTHFPAKFCSSLDSMKKCHALEYSRTVSDLNAKLLQMVEANIRFSKLLDCGKLNVELLFSQLGDLKTLFQDFVCLSQFLSHVKASAWVSLPFSAKDMQTASTVHCEIRSLFRICLENAKSKLESALCAEDFEGAYNIYQIAALLGSDGEGMPVEVIACPEDNNNEAPEFSLSMKHFRQLLENYLELRLKKIQSIGDQDYVSFEREMRLYRELSVFQLGDFFDSYQKISVAIGNLFTKYFYPTIGEVKKLFETQSMPNLATYHPFMRAIWSLAPDTLERKEAKPFMVQFQVSQEDIDLARHFSKKLFDSAITPSRQFYGTLQIHFSLEVQKFLFGDVHPAASGPIREDAQSPTESTTASSSTQGDESAPP